MSQDTLNNGPEDSDKALAFEPPGPGSWEADRDHQSAPRGRLMNEFFEEAFSEGFRDCFGRYGLPLETIEARSVNGWMYNKVRAVGAPDGGGGPPPAFVLKVLTRVVPELRRRNRTARQAIEQRLWLVDAAAWSRERATWVADGEALLDQSLVELDDENFARHVASCLDLARRMLRRHFELVGPAVAVGRLIAACEQWGLESGEVLDLLRGASPASASTLLPLHEMADLVAATGRDPKTLAELRGLSPALNAHVDEYLKHWGWRVLDDDLESPALIEVPERLVELVATVGASGSGSRGGAMEAPTRLRESVPADGRAQFDQLVEEARTAYGSLDDNAGVTTWLMGVLRRAVLELDRRASADGRLNAADVWNLSVDELMTVAQGGQAPQPNELARRASLRIAAAVNEPPAVLGPAPSAPPDASVFPQPMSDMVSAFGAFLSNKFGAGADRSSDPATTGNLLIDDQVVAVGFGIDSTEVTGRVVVAEDVSDAITRLRPGDLLVCPYTTSAWNAIFPLLGGIVTQHGGPIGHTGVMAREFGIAAVVGVGEIDSSWDGKHATIQTSQARSRRH